MSLSAHEAQRVIIALEHMVEHLRSEAGSPALTEGEAAEAEMDLGYYEGFLAHMRRQLDEHTARSLGKGISH